MPQPDSARGGGSRGSPPWASTAAAAGVVDAHHHVWDLAVRDQPWLSLPGHEPLRRAFSEADLRPQAQAAGVTRTVVVQTVTEPGETPELLGIAAGSDLIAGVVGWVDLRAADVADALAELLARPAGTMLRGIRHPLLSSAESGWLRQPAVLSGLRAVAAAGLCFDLVGHPDLLAAAAETAAAFPELIFVLDHLGNPDIGPEVDQRWARALRSLAGLPNTVCKLSGILGEPPPGTGRMSDGADVGHLVPYYEVALDAFGPGRLMFGTDWPVCTLTASYAAVAGAARTLTAALSPAERDAIFSGTACRVYRLGEVA